MKKTSTIANNLYEALKRKTTEEQPSATHMVTENGESFVALDDTERVMILSPGRLVVKRFFRNKLAMIGLVILIVMFAFAFLGAVIYPYSQTELFYKFDYLHIDYASATERTESVSYAIPGGPTLKGIIVNRFNSYISELESEGAMEKIVTGTDGEEYVVSKLGERVYTLSTAQVIPIGIYTASSQVAIYDRILRSFDWIDENLPAGLADAMIEEIADISGNAAQFEYLGVSYSIEATKTKATFSRLDPGYSGSSPGNGFVSAIEENLSGADFEFGGGKYRVTDTGGGSFDVSEIGGVSAAYIASTYVFNSYDVSFSFSDEFRVNALFAIYGEGDFIADGVSYTVQSTGEDLFITDSSGKEIADLSVYSVRRYSGQDTLTIGFKEAAQSAIEDMRAANRTKSTFVYAIHEIDADGNFLYEDNGDPIYADSEITVTRKNTGEFVLTVDQITYLIDIFGAPSKEHPVGTDGDGMDVLSRMMYGGRVTLMVGFVVVILEIVLGVIMGGISGFFSGWVDTLIMRIADVFYCIPTLPILIILGALFDKLKMDPYQRLVWMMATLGLLGWASVARLVRGQILSLREQEFMIAQEATGMRSSRRIFRHLVPNVMPQLIVTATMGVGDVIITESTLSFLGLGVKHPLATWGNMIDAITKSPESMIRYSYIWVPIGLLICLTVIAFNFAGDGLRDAFDPKMKR